MTVSGGLLALAPTGPGLSLSDALARADAALYRAKAEGRNRIVRGRGALLAQSLKSRRLQPEPALRTGASGGSIFTKKMEGPASAHGPLRNLRKHGMSLILPPKSWHVNGFSNLG